MVIKTIDQLKGKSGEYHTFNCGTRHFDCGTWGVVNLISTIVAYLRYTRHIMPAPFFTLHPTSIE
jgi:hypothetical protein